MEAQVKRLWRSLFTVTMVIDEVLENGVLYRASLINFIYSVKSSPEEYGEYWLLLLNNYRIGESY